MTNKEITQLEKQYDKIQKQFRVESGNGSLTDATQFSVNQDLPVHRWFHFKEGFAANILTAAGVDTSILNDEGKVFLDPFCGSGTSLLAGDIQHHWHCQRIGVEINPFLSFVTRTKTSWRDYKPDRIEELGKKILATPLKRRLPRNQWPELSTFHNSEMFSPSKVSALVDAVNRIYGLTDLERDVLMLGIAAAAERVSFYRKDGRALRKLRSKSKIVERKNLVVDDVLRDIWSGYATDLRLLQSQDDNNRGSCMVIQGDGREISFPDGLEIMPGQVNLIAYSPPYLNQIDYTEVYKVELWLLRFVTNQEQMLSLRKQTLRSHASVAFFANGTNLPEDVINSVLLAASIVEKTGTKWHLRFRDTAFGYFEDMLSSLSRQYELLVPNGQAVCVVANSSHGSKSHRVPVVSDLLIARLAQSIGFEVEKLLVARKMPRRDSINGFSRESVIILKRPG